jgi:hypothetical protein
MANTYTCPACGAVLRPAQAVPAGKKLKCPKCATVFAPEVEPAEEAAPPFKLAPAEPVARPAARKLPAKAAAANKPAKKKADGDDEYGEATPYGVVHEEETEEDAALRKVNYGPIKNKFEKSKRGPAVALVTKPATYLLGQGALKCLAGLVICIYAVFPMIFNDKPLGDERLQEQWLIFAGGLGLFAYGAIIVHGAYKMQMLESYPWAMIAAVMAAVLGLGIISIKKLRDPRVIAGFEETKFKGTGP